MSDCLLSTTKRTASFLVRPVRIKILGSLITFEGIALRRLDHVYDKEPGRSLTLPYLTCYTSHPRESSQRIVAQALGSSPDHY